MALTVGRFRCSKRLELVFEIQATNSICQHTRISSNFLRSVSVVHDAFLKKSRFRDPSSSKVALNYDASERVFFDVLK